MVSLFRFVLLFAPAKRDS